MTSLVDMVYDMSYRVSATLQVVIGFSYILIHLPCFYNLLQHRRSLAGFGASTRIRRIKPYMDIWKYRGDHRSTGHLHRPGKGNTGNFRHLACRKRDLSTMGSSWEKAGGMSKIKQEHRR